MKLYFKNDGEIDEILIKTMGVNVKQNDSAIGFFGTGLKYAIAVFLRENQSITIYSGLKKISFAKSSKTIQGKTFDFVEMNSDGETSTLGFTTELGKNWKVWQAFREIYCNALDEGGSMSLDDVIPESGKTVIVLEGDLISKVYENRSKYFLENRTPIYTSEHLDCYYGETNSIYYKGICVFNTQKPLKYTYNIKKKIDLSEDRTALYEFQIKEAICDSLFDCHELEIIENILCANENHFENSLDVESSGKFKTNNEIDAVFLQTRRELKPINYSLVLFYKKNKPEMAKYIFDSYKTNVIEEKMMAKAINFLVNLGLFNEKYEICVVETLGYGTLGLALNNKIYISKDIFNHGTKYLASTLLEEFIHLDRKYFDCTRELQTHLFDTVISLGERLNGEPI